MPASVECWRRSVMPSRRLLCFPHAGAGAAAFQSWPAALPSDVQVCALRLPGREQLVSVAPFEHMAPLIDWAVESLEPWLALPFVVFGHSLGALIAFEFSRALRSRGLPAPRALLVSAHRAPQLPRNQPPVAELPEADFIAHLTQMEGTPAAAFEHAELRALLLPALRSDFRVLEGYEYASEPPFEFPIQAWGGAHDPLVPAADLQPWAAHTRAAYRVRVFAGRHFYLHSERDAMLRELRVVLAASEKAIR